MSYKHGVYVSEQTTSLTAPVESYAGLQVIVGTAPVNVLEDSASAVNTPILVNSWAEAVEKLGYSDDWAHYTLCQSMYACFKVFNVKPVIFINVLDPANTEHITVVAAATKPVLSGYVPLGQALLRDTLVVKSSDGETTYQENADYLTEYDEVGNLRLICITGRPIAAATTLSISGSILDPEKVTTSDIIGAVNASTGAESGLEVIRQIYPKYGYVPGLLLAPGWSHNATVAAALQAKTEGINGSFRAAALIDISTVNADLYTEVKTEKESIAATSENAVALWPMVTVGDYRFYYSAIYGALIAYTDAQNGDVPIKSPSNKSLRITGTCLASGAEVRLDPEQANTLNGQGIVTALNVNGYKAWGNNTCAYPGNTDPKDRWISVRRFFSWQANNFILTYFQKVDEPANYKLIESIVDSENIKGNSYVARGYCAACRLAFLTDENPVTSILGGTVKFHQYMAPYTPAESIENVLEFDPDAISAALGG